jgi:hypothetical protein
LREIGMWTLLLGMSIPVWAAERPGAISGYVRDAGGQPQMGATVEILGAANHTLTVFTDGAGYYIAAGLLPGLYSLQVTAPSFLPAVRERIGVRPGASLNVNVTLSTLFNVMQLGPIRAVPDEDDWKWTLRSVANRPILRVFDDASAKSTAEGTEAHDLRGTLSFFAGSVAAGYGTGSDMSTAFTLERSVFAEGQLNFSGSVGYGQVSPAAILHAGFSQRMEDGSRPSLGLTVRRFSPTDPNLHNAALQALALSASDDMAFGNVLELRFGSELQTIQFLGEVSASRPFASLDLHLSPNTLLEYNYATSRPDPRAELGFDSSPADLSETNPRVSVLGYTTQVESAHHQEVSLSRRIGRTKMQVAMYSDHVENPALTGVGDVTAEGGFLLPDLASGTFNYAGPKFSSNGLRIVVQRRLSNNFAATLDYAYGGVLDLGRPDVPLQDAQQWITTQRRQAIAAKFSGTIHRTHTYWIASYRYVNGPAVSPVDLFNVSPGQTEPFLNVFIRQPLPTLGFLPSHMEAIIDVRNLLAEGYVPVLSQDGETVYLVQSARSVRGGVAFTF